MNLRSLHSIYGKKEATPSNELWSLCKIEETGLKAKIDVGSREQVWGDLSSKKEEEHVKGSMICYHEHGHYKRYNPKLKKDSKKKKEEAHIIEEVEEAEKKKSKEEEVKDLYSD